MESHLPARLPFLDVSKDTSAGQVDRTKAKEALRATALHMVAASKRIYV